MNKQRLSLLLLVLLIIHGGLFAKDFPKILDTPVKLSKVEQRRIDNANELINKGLALWNELNAKYNPDNISSYKIDSTYNKDAYPILVKMGDLFLEGNTKKFEVYHKKCTDFWEQQRYKRPTGLENAKKLQKEALQYFDSAALNRRTASNYINEYAKAYDRYYEAISLEIISCKKEGRALQSLLDWPIHYSYPWDDDIEANLFAPDRVAYKKEVPKPVVVEAAKPVVAENKPVEAKPSEVKPLPDSLIIYYKVQIAAHTVRMTDKYIKTNIYAGNKQVDELKEDGWYKYTIGKFQTFDEANKLLNELKVSKAFVVAYKNNKRVPIKEVENLKK